MSIKFIKGVLIMQQNMSLPFKTNQPDYQICSYAPGTFPFTPQLNGIMPDISYLAIHAACSVANEVSSKAYQSASRMFTFNQLAYNNWQNAEFLGVVQLALNIISLNVRKGIYPNREYGLVDAVESACRFQTSINISSFPGLMPFLTNENINNARSNVSLYGNVANEIASMFQTNSTPMMTNQMQPPMPYQQAYPQQPQPYSIPRNVGMSNVGMGVGGGFNQNVNSANGRFANNTTVAPGNDRYQNVAITPIDPMPVAPVPNPPTMTPPVVNLKWVPSPAQYYQSAFNHRTHDLTLISTRSASGEIFVTEVIKLKESNVDRNAHSLTALPKAHLYDGDDRMKTLLPKVNDLATITADDITRARDTGEVGLLSEYIDPDWTVDTFLESIILQARISKECKNKKDDCSVYRSYSFLAKPFLSEASLKEPLAKLAVTTNFIELARAIRTAVANVDTEFAGMGGRFISQVDLFYATVEKMMTDIIQSFIHVQLGLSTVNIDSFSEDILELKPYLIMKVGSAYGRALEVFEKDVFDLIFDYRFNTSDGSLFESIASESITEDNVVFLTQSYSVTLLDVWDKELGLKIDNTGVLMLTETNTPLLYKVASSLFEQQAINDRALHNLLITQDDVRYKLHLGCLGSECYLISRM